MHAARPDRAAALGFENAGATGDGESLVTVEEKRFHAEATDDAVLGRGFAHAACARRQRESRCQKRKNQASVYMQHRGCSPRARRFWRHGTLPGIALPTGRVTAPYLTIRLSHDPM